MKAGPTGFGLARKLIEAAWPAIVTSPGDVPTTRHEARSDRRDAQRLAIMAAKKLLKPIHIPTADHDRERQIQRQRQQCFRWKDGEALGVEIVDYH